MTSLDAALEYARSQRDANLEELKSLIAVPSISTLPENKADVLKTAEWFATQLRALGMTRVDIIPGRIHPLVYAERVAAPGQPTVLVYGHYDVQPVDPIDEWNSPPFEPTIKGDYLYARGASDMKAQIFAQLKAVEALTRENALSVNIKYLLEGEEEIGSPSLEPFIEQHAEMFKCDFVLNCDSGIAAPDLPGICYGLRGLAYFELELRGPAKDLHSGQFGGAVHNPAQVLCDLISGMHDDDGHVTLPGFYDKVRPLTEEERDELAKLPGETEEDWKRMAGVPALWGETGYTPTEQTGARPTLEVNGFISGFTGEGAKTVLPARALAKISTRLVADQVPSEVEGQLRAYLEKNAPNTVTWELRELSHGPGALMDRKSPYMQAAVRALTEVFGVEPVFKRTGGSVPVVGMLQQRLGVDSVMLGFALPDDGIHGPNEKQHIPTFFKGIETYIRFMASL